MPAHTIYGAHGLEQVRVHIRAYIMSCVPRVVLCASRCGIKVLIKCICSHAHAAPTKPAHVRTVAARLLTCHALTRRMYNTWNMLYIIIINKPLCRLSCVAGFWSGPAWAGLGSAFISMRDTCTYPYHAYMYQQFYWFTYSECS